MKNNIKKTLLATLLASSAFMPAIAQAELSANVSATSNYVWRGMTQTDDGFAIQGGVDYADASGFYAGTWASNVDDWGIDASFEIDFYAGYAGSAAGWDYDLGYVLYAYPGTDVDVDFGEVYANFGKGDLSLGVAVLANAEGADFADTIYLSAGYSLAVVEGYDVSVNAGYWAEGFENSLDFGASIGKDFWSVGASMATEGDDELKVFGSVAWDFAL